MLPKPKFVDCNQTIQPDRGYDLNAYNRKLVNNTWGGHNSVYNGPRGPQSQSSQPQLHFGRDFRKPKLDGIKCNINGCKFTSDHDTIALHKKIQHFELRNKLNVSFQLNTPEDIQQWREERKKRFPTLSKANLKKNENEKGQTNQNKRRGKHANRNWKDKRARFDAPQQNRVVADGQANVGGLPNNRKNEDERRGKKMAGADESEDSRIITSVINKLINNVEHNLKLDKQRKAPPPQPRRQVLRYAELTLFQKLMLNDLDNVRQDIMDCLNVIVKPSKSN